MRGAVRRQIHIVAAVDVRFDHGGCFTRRLLPLGRRLEPFAATVQTRDFLVYRFAVAPLRKTRGVHAFTAAGATKDELLVAEILAAHGTVVVILDGPLRDAAEPVARHVLRLVAGQRRFCRLVIGVGDIGVGDTDVLLVHLQHLALGHDLVARRSRRGRKRVSELGREQRRLPQQRVLAREFEAFEHDKQNVLAHGVILPVTVVWARAALDMCHGDGVYVAGAAHHAVPATHVAHLLFRHQVQPLIRRTRHARLEARRHDGDVPLCALFAARVGRA